jgi:hypothetical protein
MSYYDPRTPYFPNQGFSPPMKPSKILDKIVDVVLSYKPPAKTKKAKKRQRKRRKHGKR